MEETIIFNGLGRKGAPESKNNLLSIKLDQTLKVGSTEREWLWVCLIRVTSEGAN